MKETIFKTLDKFGVKSDRTKNIVKHIGWSTFYKIGSVLANFMLVPLTINYLDTEQYGIWLTLTSFISWFSFLDIGLGNGLRNKFAEAKAEGNFTNAQAFVSTAYFTIGAISIGAMLIFICINPLVNWSNVFNTHINLSSELSLLIPLIFAFFALQMVAKLITSIYQANQNHSIQNKVQFLIQSVSLLFIWLLTKTEGSSLLLFGSVFSALPVVVLIVLNLVAFKSRFKYVRPKYTLWKSKYLKEITSLGFKFFVIQIAALVLFSSDNFIITQLFGPEEVVPYNIAFKYFSIVTIAYTIIITPFWSSFTEAYAKKDFEWIKKSVTNIQKIWLFIPVILIVMVLISGWFYKLWVGEKVVVPIGLSLSMALFVTLMTFNMIYVNFINGIGKIKLQLITSLLSISINIPLSIYLGKYLGWESTGVILATCFSLGYSVILRPMQYYKIINNKAKGIWNK